MTGSHTGSPRTHHRHADAVAQHAAFRRRVVLGLVAVLVPVFAAVGVGMVVMWPEHASGKVDLGATGYVKGTSFVTATVTKVDPFQCASVGSAPGPNGTLSKVTCAHVEARVESGTGTARGQVAKLDLEPPTVRSGIQVGDRLQLARFPAGPGEPDVYVFVDFERTLPMIWLAVVFAVLVCAVARFRGLAAIAGLLVSFVVLVKFMIPALLSGEQPLLVGLIGSAAIMLVVLYLAHGVSIRTTTALVGTLFGLCSSALLAAWAVSAMHLSGVATEDDLTVSAVASQVKLSGLLLCGIIVASLGILNDVTVTQASAVWELHELRPDAGSRRLFTGAMRIGRDHIASTVYTIAFAYAGAALPILLLIDVSQQPFATVITREALAEEVARTLVGSIGLVLSVPLTTLVGVLIVRASRASFDGARDDAVEDNASDALPPAVTSPAERDPDLSQILEHYKGRRQRES